MQRGGEGEEAIKEQKQNDYPLNKITKCIVELEMRSCGSKLEPQNFLPLVKVKPHHLAIDTIVFVRTSCNLLVTKMRANMQLILSYSLIVI